MRSAHALQLALVLRFLLIAPAHVCVHSKQRTMGESADYEMMFEEMAEAEQTAREMRDLHEMEMMAITLRWRLVLVGSFIFAGKILGFRIWSQYSLHN